MSSDCGGEEGIARLLAVHRPRVFGYLRSAVRDTADAEDMTQETMLRAWCARHGIRDHGAIATWLYRIATNVMVDRARSQARRPVIVDTTPLDDVTTGMWLEDGTRRAEQREMSACVDELVAALSDPQRAALLLHDALGLSNPEIAEMLGCSVAAVKIRLHRARARVGDLVADRCTVGPDDRGIVVCEPRSRLAEERVTGCGLA